MFKTRVFERIFELLPPFAALMTPLLFFVDGRDQFELPKLTFLAVTGTAAFALMLALKGIPRLSPLATGLLVLFTVQTAASLPGTSLSWRTSLLGDYENFSGLMTSACYLLWFFALSSSLTDRLIKKTLFFFLLAAFLSSLYALGQHAGFDFVQWNPESVIGNRDFASLGNPNFLAAYLAMCLPLVLLISGRHAYDPPPAPAARGYAIFPSLALMGSIFLLAGTSRGAALFGGDPGQPPTGPAIAFGWTFLCIALVRFGRLASWPHLGIAGTLLLLGLVRTGSRGGFLAAFVGLAAIPAFILLDRDLRDRAGTWVRRIHPVLRIGVPVAATSLALALNLAFLRRLGDTVLDFTGSLGTSRLHIWKPALAMVRENPILGVGLDTFKIAFPAYSGHEFNRIDGIFVSSRTAHNEWLQAAAATGLLGLAAQIAVLLLFIGAIRKAWDPAGPRSRWTLAGLASCALAYQVQNLFSFGVAAINLLWFFCLASASALQPQEQRNPRFSPVLRRTLAVLLLASVSIASLIRLTADVAFGHGSSALDYVQSAGKSLGEREKALYTEYGVAMNRRAVDLMPLEVKYRLYLGLAYERKAGLVSEGSATWLRKALENYDRSLVMSPYNAYYHNNRERILLALWRETRQEDLLAAAERAGRRAVELAPESPFFKVQWAVALLRSDRRDEARRVLSDSFGLTSDFTAKALAQLATDEYLRGDGDFALLLLDQAVQGNTASAEAYQVRGLVLQQMGRTEDALRDLMKARQLRNPSSGAR